MAKTHFSGPLEVGGKQLTDNPPIANIPDPNTATAADVANKVNEILAMLRSAGIIRSS